jgi:hypothetical protein
MQEEEQVEFEAVGYDMLDRHPSANVKKAAMDVHLN